MTILLEVCVDCSEGLRAAIQGGADRIELCSALELGGLTPSPGLIAQAAKLKDQIPIYAMIRPRSGDFVYSQMDLESMESDFEAVREAGLAGIVIGANKADGTGQLDEKMLARLAARAQGMGMTLHRCFDLVPDLGEAVECAVRLGFERILTSGRARNALDGVDDLVKIVEYAGSRISIMPGSGLNSGNVAKLVEKMPLALKELHSSCSLPMKNPLQISGGEEEMDLNKKLIELGFVGKAERKVTSREEVESWKG